MKNSEVKPITERTFDFAVRIVKLAQSLDEKPGTSRILANQLLRSGTSVGANVEEAQGGQSKADFISKMSIALKEARETLYWLKLLVASGVCEEKKLTELIDEANQIVSILVTIVKRSKRKN